MVESEVHSKEVTISLQQPTTVMQMTSIPNVEALSSRILRLYPKHRRVAFIGGLMVMVEFSSGTAKDMFLEEPRDTFNRLIKWKRQWNSDSVAEGRLVWIQIVGLPLQVRVRPRFIGLFIYGGHSWDWIMLQTVMVDLTLLGF